MSWFKVDDQLAFNAKIVAAGNEAMGLWVRAGSWSAAQLTNGFIPEHMAIAMANGMAKYGKRYGKRYGKTMRCRCARYGGAMG